MLILTIRTDKPEAEVGLFNHSAKIWYEQWQAHRILAETLHHTIRRILQSQNLREQDVEGVVCFQGPGSFTGLRIGLTVGNALAYGLGIPIVGTQGDDWLQQGIARLVAGKNEGQVLPFYGAPVHITSQKR